MTDTPDAIDALLGAGPRRAVALPEPAEREWLRTEYGLTKSETAKALGISTSTFTAWESGQRDPQGEGRAAYAKLLDGMAARLIPAAPAQPTPAQPTPAPAPAPAHTQPVAPAAFGGPAELDRTPSGELVTDTPQPCVRCGRPTPYRAAGQPMHVGGFCAPAPVPTAAAAATEPAAVPAVPAAAPAPAPAPAPARRPAPTAAPVRSARSAPASRSSARPARKAASRAAAPAYDARAAAAEKFPNGPLAVVAPAPFDRHLVAHLVEGRALDVPALTLPELTEWTLTAGLGEPRLHKHGKDGDPLIVLTDAAATLLGLPPMGSDADGHFERRLGRLPESHKTVKALTKAGWQLTQRGFGPWARVYRTPDGAKRSCVQYCIPAWAALTSAGWTIPDGLDPAQLAALLGGYAERVMTPRGSTAVTGLSLMEALRPPTRAVRTESGWTSGPVEGSRTRAFDPAPPEAPSEHPVAQDRDPADVLVTEAWDWIRPVEAIGEAERALPHVVGLDINTAFLAAAGRLTMALSEPVHELNPVFDPKIPGSWKCDFSTAQLDPRLPNPFTPDGLPPTGPAWYTTAKVAYARELGLDVAPTEGWLRHESGPWLDPWHKHLRAAYLTTMDRLGVPLNLGEQDPEAFLDAMAGLKEHGDPIELAILAAVKATAKGGVGKLRERPRGASYRPGQRWPALERPTWDPLNRALIIDTATVNQHRKIRRHAATTGQLPIAILSDCTVYPSPGPSALDLLRGPDGTLTSVWRLGTSPGMCKHEGTQTMDWALELIADDTNPGRHIKGGDAVAEGE
ncbi:telomere-associated protein Tap [Kitasatospora sp. DSM 101779]|uniref:telomere-associated protein Tap n=1 Tax=Kitasatospora sp. DSM 101779 TaxID=2853165 RepID=UPI0021DB1621|nr:helix-turn-helix transcriptional regulator [Kitasatospora sp. DSM 101779]MCU7820192.1 helix-turn-helix transcriptional regulator [Kitasatospora sp. DSM 101779]